MQRRWYALRQGLERFTRIGRQLLADRRDRTDRFLEYTLDVVLRCSCLHWSENALHPLEGRDLRPWSHADIDMIRLRRIP
jgi:hypothetical protein